MHHIGVFVSYDYLIFNEVTPWLKKVFLFVRLRYEASAIRADRLLCKR
jgi:hypothetical protein